jgi:hypothetical protein
MSYLFNDMPMRTLRTAANELLLREKSAVMSDVLRKDYGINLPQGTNDEYVEVLLDSLKRLPTILIKDCGIVTLGFEDQGPSKEYYPNHGKYVNNTLFINQQIIEDPLLIVDPDSGASFNKFDQTLYHELGHGWDEFQSDDNVILSLKPEWMELSGWSEAPIPGHKRVIIQDKDSPKLVGEYYYSPEAEFTRFYAKRNPWDDWADSFSYYVANLKSFLPKNKIAYFDNMLGKYYKGK